MAVIIYILRIPLYTTDIAYLIITNRIFMGFWFYVKTSKYIIYLGKITSYDIDLRHMLWSNIFDPRPFLHKWNHAKSRFKHEKTELCIALVW